MECHSKDGDEIRQAANSMERAELLGKSLHLVRYLKREKHSKLILALTGQ